MPARAVQGFDQAEADRIAPDREDYGYRCAGVLRCACGSNIPRCGNGRYAHGHKLSGKFRQCFVGPFSPPLLDADITAFNEPCPRQSFAKRVSIEAIGIRRCAV